LYKILINRIIYFLFKSKTLPILVSSFVGFSFGLLVAAIYFPVQMEYQLVNTSQVTLPKDTKPNTSYIQNQTEVTYKRVKFEDLDGWKLDQFNEVLPLIKKSCLKSATRKYENKFGLSVTNMKEVCQEILDINLKNNNELIRNILESIFDPFSVSTGKNYKGTFTGYFEIVLEGSYTKNSEYTVPLYGVPKDMITLNNQAFKLPNSSPNLIGQVVDNQLVPYDDRRTIKSNPEFKKRANVLVWVKDIVDAHLLHIQGSGIIKFKSGSYKRIGYAGNNGRKFKGIGSILLAKGLITKSQASMPEVAKWLKANAGSSSKLLDQNPRYIFFRWTGKDGPIGAFDIPLTPERSLAIDPRYIPYGAPIWLETKGPDQEIINRLVVALDTGAAIKGPVRGDYFWGKGEEAFYKAGRMKSKGRYFILLPKDTVIK